MNVLPKKKLNMSMRQWHRKEKHMSALLFFDIDGTLISLDDNHRMPESTKYALQQAKANGHKIFINTGRVKTAIDKHLLEFGFDGLVCGCGTYVEYQGEIIFHQTVSKEQCLEQAKILRKCKFQTIFEKKDRLFVEGEHGPGSFLEYIYNYFSKNTDYPIEGTDSPDFLYDKFTTAMMPDSNGALFFEYFSKNYNLIPHSNDVYEVVPKGLSKASGIRHVMDYLGAELSQCYAFGDSINDMEMLKYVPHSVGMGNSVKEVFSVVEYRTTDITDNGIENALKYYGLI